MLETNKKRQVICIQMHLEVMRWMSTVKKKENREVVSSEATKLEEKHEDVLFVNYGKQSLHPGAPSGEDPSPQITTKEEAMAAKEKTEHDHQR